jgi:hypothetical protein
MHPHSNWSIEKGDYVRAPENTNSYALKAQMKRNLRIFLGFLIFVILLVIISIVFF